MRRSKPKRGPRVELKRRDEQTALVEEMDEQTALGSDPAPARHAADHAENMAHQAFRARDLFKDSLKTGSKDWRGMYSLL